jgi:tRNA dimethylallyltransferase
MMVQDKACVLILCGPTGVGKTDFSLEIARYYSAEIINGDVGQFYSPLTIGTAKPDWRNERVPHHLFDTIHEPKNISSVEYRNLVIEQVNEIWARKKLPLIVGGSGFYLKSLFFPPHALVTQTNNLLTLPDDQLWKTLNAVDPQRAEQINPQDYYRLRRALAIWYGTGKKPSACQPVYDAPFRALVLYLDRDREDLHQRITLRTELMVQQGWLNEVRQLRGTAWEPFLYTKKLIGYDVLFDYLRGDQPEFGLDYAIELIQQRTRQYAKRQKTFWKSFERQLNAAGHHDSWAPDMPCAHSINLTFSDRALYITQVLKRLVVLIG